MIVFIFKCDSKPNQRAYSLLATGENIPKEPCDGKWVLLKQINITRKSILVGASADEILEGIERVGYFINVV